MERSTLVGMKRLLIAVATLALGACTDAGTREAELQDSAIQANEEPVPVAQPVQTDSVTRAPSQAPTARTPAQRTPAQPPRTEPPLRQPPPPRDTRPSIPYPPDTI